MSSNRRNSCPILRSSTEKTPTDPPLKSIHIFQPPRPSTTPPPPPPTHTQTHPQQEEKPGRRKARNVRKHRRPAFDRRRSGARKGGGARRRSLLCPFRVSTASGVLGCIEEVEGRVPTVGWGPSTGMLPLATRDLLKVFECIS
jgi:hypothetical protein